MTRTMDAGRCGRISTLLEQHMTAAQLRQRANKAALAADEAAGARTGKGASARAVVATALERQLGSADPAGMDRLLALCTAGARAAIADDAAAQDEWWQILRSEALRA